MQASGIAPTSRRVRLGRERERRACVSSIPRADCSSSSSSAPAAASARTASTLSASSLESGMRPPFQIGTTPRLFFAALT